MTGPEGRPDDATRSDLFSRVVTVNVGIAVFKESLQAQDAEVIHVNWNPPAGGDDEILDLLDSLL